MHKIALDGQLVLAGYGRMGSALVAGWLAAGLAAERLVIVEPDAGRRQAVPEGVAAHAGPDTLEPGAARGLMLAVKPQMMGAVLPQFARCLARDCLILSIAAGTAIATFEGAFPGRPVIRVMPNTPAAVGAGMSVLCANALVQETDRVLAESLLRAVGDTAWIDDEELMHAVTGLSGSGPAFVFHMVEAMAAAGAAAGLGGDLAMQLARSTVIGSARLMAEDVQEPHILRQNVTSPGGTTAAGLQQLMDGDSGLAPLMKRTIEAAANRSRELG